ncbi:MAG: hypothetical protein HY238_06700 [Acidobacteria bacterium]|nr:hypothetical protein [Acidobacteriota bacterium]
MSGTRVSLDSVVYEFRRGSSPESILRSFPLIGSLELVYGTITYYLAHKDQIDSYLADQEKLWEKMHAEQSLPPGVKERLEQARRDIATRRP